MLSVSLTPLRVENDLSPASKVIEVLLFCGPTYVPILAALHTCLTLRVQLARVGDEVYLHIIIHYIC